MPAERLTPAEKRMVKQVEQRLKLAGTLATTPREMIVDYVRLHTRIDYLHELLETLRASPPIEASKMILPTVKQIEGSLSMRLKMAKALFPSADPIGIKERRQMAAARGDGDDDGEWSALAN